MTKTKTKTIAFVGTEILHTQLKQWAAGEGRSLSNLIRRILEQEARRRAEAQQTPVK